MRSCGARTLCTRSDELRRYGRVCKPDAPSALRRSARGGRDRPRCHRPERGDRRISRRSTWRAIVSGVYGKLAALSDVLQDRDRVEILRPLVVDAKEARRRRAVKSVAVDAWIPACAGMTAFWIPAYAGMTSRSAAAPARARSLALTRRCRAAAARFPAGFGCRRGTRARLARCSARTARPPACRRAGSACVRRHPLWRGFPAQAFRPCELSPRHPRDADGTLALSRRLIWARSLSRRRSSRRRARRNRADA